MWIIVAALFATVACTAPARASQVRIPLTIDYLTLREALKRQVYTAPGGRAQLWNGLDECQFLYAENPEFSRATEPGAATVKLETANSLGLGVAMGSRCVGAIDWSGIVDALGVPYIAPGLQLKFHFTDLNLYDSAHQKTAIASRGFDLIKSYLIPRLDDFSYDLRPSVQQLAAMINDSIPADAADRVRAAVASLTAEPNIAALDDGIRVTLVMTVPDVPAPAANPGAASAATPAELKAFQDTLDQWDAFMVFSIKQLGDAVGDQQFRNQLLQILLDSRYRLVEALNSPPSAAGPDPVRLMFLDEWRQLHDAVREAAQRGMLGARALEFLSFISAGDALFALDQAAPALGMRISAADLRRLAHIMAPNATGDPLQFNNREDPEMKKLFDVPEPPRSRHPIEEEDVPPSAPVAPPNSHGTNSSVPLPIARLIRFLSPDEADAAEDNGAAQITRLQDVADRLYQLVVNEQNSDAYRDRHGVAAKAQRSVPTWPGHVRLERAGDRQRPRLRLAGAQHRMAGELLAAIRDGRRAHPMARICHRRHRPDAGEQACLARLLRYRAAEVGRAVQRRGRMRDSRAHDAVCVDVTAEVRSGVDFQPPRALGLRRLQRRSGRVQSMAPSGTAPRSSKSIPASWTNTRRSRTELRSTS